MGPHVLFSAKNGIIWLILADFDFIFGQNAAFFYLCG